MINSCSRGISRLGLILNMRMNATTETRNKIGPHPRTIPTRKRTTELVSTCAQPPKTTGAGETCVVDDEACVVDVETCVVDATIAGSPIRAPADPGNVLFGAAIIRAIPTKMIV